MDEAMKRLEADPDIWVAVLTANTTGQERPVFCAGADLKAINSGEGQSINTRDGNFAGFVYYKRQKPVIAAIDGLATAGGCEIALACDMIVATTRSAFGLAEVKRNLIAASWWPLSTSTCSGSTSRHVKSSSPVSLSVRSAHMT